MEVWKDIKGYEDLYQVSNKGNVRSLHWKGGDIVKNLVPKKHNRGYLQVELSNDCKKKTYLIHRLVAEAFIPNESGCSNPVVNHIDEDKQNNNVGNLEWCSALQNVRYSVARHPDRYSKRPGHSGCKKHTKWKHLRVIQMSTDGDVIKVWDNSRQVFTSTGMSDWSISECCRGKRKTAYGYIWQYAS